MNLSGKKFLVLGANGYIGRHLVQALTGRGAQILAGDQQSECSVAGAPYKQVDICDPGSLSGADWNVDAVLFFAGLSGTGIGFKKYDEFVAANELGLLNVLTAIRKSSFRPRVIFPSSRLVYKGAPGPLPEDAPKEAKTIYAVNKLACEEILEVYRNAFDMPYTIYRICVPYGNLLGGGYSYGTVGAFLKQAADAGGIRLYAPGDLRRTFTHIGDVCSHILDTCLSDASLHETFNVPGEDLSLLQVAKLIAGHFGAEVQLTDWPDMDRRIESGHTVFDGTKIQSKFGLNQMHSFKAWLEGIPVS